MFPMNDGTLRRRSARVNAAPEVFATRRIRAHRNACAPRIA